MKRGRNQAIAVAERADNELPTQAALEKPTTKYTRLTAAQVAKVYRLKAQGVQQREIARVVGCHESSITRALQAFEQSSEEMAAVLKTKTEDAVDQWEQAISVAASRGDHRPARELIEAAHPKLRPQPAMGAGNQGGIVINIGAPGAPIRLPDIEISPERKELSPSVSVDLHKVSADK